MTAFSTRDLALHALRVASDKGGEDLRLLQLPKGNGVADYVVIATGTSDRQVNAIVSEIYSFCKRHKIPNHGVEGESGWFLIDLMDVIVHAFDEEKRTLYDLDHAYPLALQVAFEKDLKALPDPDKTLQSAKRER